MSFNLTPKLLLSWLLVGFCGACYPDYRECPCSYQDTRKRFYSQALTEIAEHVLYPSYLAGLPAHNRPDAGDWPYLLNLNDSADHRVIWYYQQLTIAQNRLFQDTARFQTLYLDTTAQRLFAWRMRDYSQHNEATDAFWQCLLEEAGFHPPDMRAAIDSLCTLQQTVPPQTFQTCTFRVKLAKLRQNPDTTGTIGVIYLSKALVNAKQRRALLAFDYHCGPRCGFRKLLVLENRNYRWRIKEVQPLSSY